jgi:hypothetical protein
VVKPPKISSPNGRDGCRPKISMNLERFQRPAGPGTKLRVAMMACVPWKWSVILYLQHSVITIPSPLYYLSTELCVYQRRECVHNHSSAYQKSVNLVTPLILCELRRKATAITKPSFFSPLKWPSSNTCERCVANG